jgi:copper(I)-binding protein
MKKWLVLAAFGLVACGAPQAPQTRGLHVEDGWASPTPGGVNVSAGYLIIVNDSDAADRLTGAASQRATSVSLHEMSMDGPVMQMRDVAQIDVPAHGRVTLAPSGMHLMFNGVTTPFSEGERIPVQLTFEHAGAVSADLSVSRTAPTHQH